MFQPQIPFAGIAGWRFLERTQERQAAAFERSPQLERDIAYFEEKIGSVSSAAELVADRRLLTVALGAFGMETEIDKKAFIRKVLEEGTEKDDAFANRLVDPAYKKLAEAFGFGNASGARTGDPAFVRGIVADYKTRAFETAVGNADNSMRLAMNFAREAPDLSAGDGKSWYVVLSSAPLRQIFEKAFGLPSQFVNIDIDQQAKIMAQKAEAVFGSDSLSVFQDPAQVDRLITRFLARVQMEQGAAVTGPAANALVLLQGLGSGGSQGLLNLLYPTG
jgi:hypothetical protein